MATRLGFQALAVDNFCYGGPIPAPGAAALLGRQDVAIRQHPIGRGLQVDLEELDDIPGRNHRTSEIHP